MFGNFISYNKYQLDLAWGLQFADPYRMDGMGQVSRNVGVMRVLRMVIIVTIKQESS